MKNNKGFTLVELLSVIFVLGIIITIAVVSFRGTHEAALGKIDEASEKNLKNIAQVYFTNNEGKDDFKSYLNQNNKTISCIRLKTLIDNKYINPKDYDETIINDYFVKITKYGKDITTELLPLTDTEDCYNYQTESGTEDINVSIGDTNIDEVGDYNLVETIKPTGEKNVYNVTMKFNTKVIQKVEVTERKTMNVYVAIDRSGSMSGSRYSNARTAAITMSQQLMNENSSTMMGLVEFNSSASLSCFVNRALTTGDFTYASGGTDASKALSVIYNHIISNRINNDNNIIFVVLLSDGASSNTSQIINYANQIKNLGGYIATVGYDLYSGYSYYTSIPSDICGSDNNQKCYFNANTSNLASVFSSIATSIIEETSKSSMSNVKMKVDVDKYLTVLGSDMETSEGNTLSEFIDLSEYDQDDYTITKTFRVKLNMDELVKDCKTEVCTVTVPVNNLQLVITSVSNEQTIKAFDDSMIPTLTITFNKKSVMN